MNSVDSHSSNDDGDNINQDPQVERCNYTANYATLDTLIDDCLRYIFYYLDAYETAKLGLTCTRLYDFASDCASLEKYKQIEIVIDDDYLSKVRYNVTMDAYETAKLGLKCTRLYDFASDCASLEIYKQIEIIIDDDYLRKFRYHVTMASLESEFIYLGPYVRRLTWRGCPLNTKVNDNIMLSFKNIHKMFPNLDTLRILNIQVMNNDIAILKNVTANLKQLEILHCPGIINDWSHPTFHLSKLNHLNMYGAPETSNAFFYQQFNCLTSLTLNNYYHENISPEVLEWIFNLNGHCMQHLILKLDHVCHSDTIGALIKKLPKLVTLKLDFLTDSLVNSLSELNNLRSLKLYCRKNSCNSLLRMLSGRGIIEYLEISDSFFENEDDNESPLSFQKLKTLNIGCLSKISSFLKLITKSQMPEISSFEFEFLYSKEESDEHDFSKFEESDLHGFLDLIRSKETLKSLCISNRRILIYNEFEFVSQIIDILMEPSASSRPIFNLIMPLIIREDKMIEMLNENEHLIKLSTDKLYEIQQSGEEEFKEDNTVFHVPNNYDYGVILTPFPYNVV